MIRRIKYLLLIVSFPVVLHPQIIQKIDINGNRTFSDSDIKSWGQIGEGTRVYPGLLDTLKSRVALNLSLRGYFYPDFKNSRLEYSADSQKVFITLNVNEGEPTYIKTSYFSGNDSVKTKEYEPVFKFLEGQVFDKYELEEYINDLLTKLENDGYPFAVFTIKSVYLYRDSVKEKNYADLYIDLNTGVESRIDKIKVEGNASTKDYVVIRELRIEPGEYYSQKKIEELPKRLNRLRFFAPVATPQFYIDSDNKGVLLIKIKEKQTNNFDGIIGYIPPAKDNETGYVTGLINISLRNLFGTGRAAAFRWRKLDRNSQELELKYLEPWLIGFPLNLNLRFYQRQQDTIYVQRNVDAGLEYLATENVSASVFVTSESVIPTLTEEPVFTVFNSSSLTTGINLRIDTRDDPLAPMGGLLFNNTYKFSRKKINGPAEFITPDTQTDINLQRFEATLAVFYELFRRQVVALTLNGRELRGPFFEQSDLYRLGGAFTLRGYREDQFLGNRIYWSNLEYRFFLSRRTFAFLFFDTGYYLRNADDNLGIPKAEEFKIGYGLGINLETGIGILGVSFALAKGDSFSEGKIHFGIINEF
ncbi:outer membrane protein assembly factor BamA precursor [bacterium BMS3Abin03]|nr:outer membrane protein assembly factor BamA precursor [bacterium BMS3Abin03]